MLSLWTFWPLYRALSGIVAIPPRPATERPAAMAPLRRKRSTAPGCKSRGEVGDRITKTQVEDSTAPIGRGGWSFDLLATADEQRQELVREPAPHTGKPQSNPLKPLRKKGRKSATKGQCKVEARRALQNPFSPLLVVE